MITSNSQCNELVQAMSAMSINWTPRQSMVLLHLVFCYFTLLFSAFQDSHIIFPAPGFYKSICAWCSVLDGGKRIQDSHIILPSSGLYNCAWTSPIIVQARCREDHVEILDLLPTIQYRTHCHCSSNGRSYCGPYQLPHIIAGENFGFTVIVASFLIGFRSADTHQLQWQHRWHPWA